jgi:hypothetical protein
MFPLHHRWQLPSAVYLLASLRLMVAAQTITPSNGSLPVDPNSLQLQLNSKYDIDPLTDGAGLGANAQQLQVSVSAQFSYKPRSD